jgi:glycerol uptake facilitator-like aquaporin
VSDPRRALAAEFLGTLILVATVVGSGVMAQRLSGGNDAVALIGNTGATGAVLYVLISTLGDISGAHFNPAVTLLLGPRDRWLGYIAAQIAGGISGALLVHAMFGMTILEWGMKPRTGAGQWLGEFVATFGLLFTIVLGSKYRPAAIPGLVALWIVAGYWFTSSTSFANPAVTIARALTDSFAGLRPIDVPGFIVAQLLGASTGWAVGGWLTRGAGSSEA